MATYLVVVMAVDVKILVVLQTVFKLLYHAGVCPVHGVKRAGQGGQIAPPSNHWSCVKPFIQGLTLTVKQSCPGIVEDKHNTHLFLSRIPALDSVEMASFKNYIHGHKKFYSNTPASTL